MADRPDIGEHAEAFEAGAGFMRAFGVLIAALASVRRGLRRVFVAVSHLGAVRVHRTSGCAVMSGKGNLRGIQVRGDGMIMDHSHASTWAKH